MRELILRVFFKTLKRLAATSFGNTFSNCSKLASFNCLTLPNSFNNNFYVLVQFLQHYQELIEIMILNEHFYENLLHNDALHLAF